MKWREGVFYNYEGYFGKRKFKPTEDDEVRFGPSFDTKKWQWMMMVDKIVKEQYKTPEEIYNMNYIDCLNWLSLYKERDKYIEQIEKQHMKKI